MAVSRLARPQPLAGSTAAAWTQARLRLRLILPILLAAAALAGQLLASQPRGPEGLDSRLAVRVIADVDGRLDASGALAALAAVAPQAMVSNARSSGPFWIALDVPAFGSQFEPDVVVLGDRHLQRAQVWTVQADGTMDGPFTAQRGSPDGTLLAAASDGFVLRLHLLPERPVRLLVRATLLGAGYVTADRQLLAQWEGNEHRLQRSAGILGGTIATLAIAAGVVAWLSRSPVFVLFVPWLLAVGALTAISTGNDYLLISSYPSMRIETIAKQGVLVAHSALSASLFLAMFRRPLARLGALRMLRWLPRAAWALSAPALLLPAHAFLPIFHGFALAELAIYIVCLGAIVTRSRTYGAGRYLAAWLVQIIAALSEIMSAIGVPVQVPGLTIATGGLIGALMTGAGLIDVLASERRTRMRAQGLAEASAHHYRAIYDMAPGGILQLAANGLVTGMNHQARHWLGVDPEMRRVEIAALFGVQNAAALLSAPAAQDPAECEWTRPADEAGGRAEQTFALRAKRVNDGRIEVMMSDVTARVELARTLRMMTLSDPLTRLGNRRALEQALDAWLRGPSTDRTACLVHLDLDRFKLVNDAFGHGAGDRVLQRVAQELREALPPQATLARLGGDEFAVLLPEHSITVARSVAAALVQSIAQAPLDVGASVVEVGAHAGVIEITDEMDVKDALACADRACRQAKSRGLPGTIVSYAATDGTLADYHGEARLADALRSGAILSQLELFAQPLVPMKPDRAGALEMLLRVRDDAGRARPPGKLLAVAERTGFMPAIDRFVLTRTLEHMDQHPSLVHAVEFFAINLSGASLNDARFVADAQALLAEHPHAARRICLEITESVALYDANATARFIDAMGAHGVRIALDDFGAGYTSFAYLAQLRAQILKLDGAFVRDLAAKPANGAIIGAILELARKLGMRTIAEWIEDADAHVALAGMGADFGQGYFYSPAQPLAFWLDHPLPTAPTTPLRPVIAARQLSAPASPSLRAV